jgi:5'-nucleotidase
MKMEVKPIALFDLDGTLADYDEALQRDLKLLAGPNDPVIDEVKRDDWPEWLDNRRKVITSQPGWFKRLNRYAPGFILWMIAEDLGFSNHILTKGPGKNRAAWTEKAEWCDIHVPGRPIHVVTEKSLTYGRVLVDDWPAFFLGWLKWRPRGLVVAPAHPWNAGVEHPNVIRFDGSNLDAVQKRLEHAYNRQDGEGQE